MDITKKDNTKVNIIEQKINLADLLDIERWMVSKLDIKKVREEHAVLNQNYFTENISSKVKYKGTSDFLRVIFPNSNQCLLEIKLEAELTDTLKFTGLIFYTKEFKFENNVEDAFILGEIITKIQKNYNQVLDKLNKICIKIDPKVKKYKNRLLFIKRFLSSLNKEPHYKWVFNNIKEKLTTEGIIFNNNNSNYFNFKWRPFKIKLDKYTDTEYYLSVYENEDSKPINIIFAKDSFAQTLEYIFINGYFITNLEKNIIFNKEEYIQEIWNQHM